VHEASYLHRIDTLGAVWASWAEVGGGLEKEPPMSARGGAAVMFIEAATGRAVRSPLPVLR
jgi:hypothetical protein